jgi:hypothetical protein
MPTKWEELLKRLQRRQAVQTTADLRRISKNIKTLKAEIRQSLEMWDALASQGDRTGLMMAGHLRRLTDNLDRIMANATQAITNDLSGSWQVWWGMGNKATTDAARAAGFAVTELAIQGEKLDLYQQYIPELIKSVGDTTKAKMANLIRTSSLAGENRATIQRKMFTALMGEPARHGTRFGGFNYQVERIYRTESQRLYNMASHEAAITLNEKVGTDLVKVWNHSGASALARPDHVEMDGEIADLEEPFSNGLMYPKDPAGAPEDTINCMCYMSHLPRDQADEIVAGDKDEQSEPQPEPQMEPEPERTPEPEPEPTPEPQPFAELQPGAVEFDPESPTHAMQEWESGLEPGERSALRDYSGGEYRAINSELRAGETDPERVGALDAALEKASLPETFQVYRGASLDSLPDEVSALMGVDNEQFMRALEGSVLQDQGYLSTTVSEGLAQTRFTKDNNVMYQILAPEGSHGGFLGPLLSRNADEQEILFARGSQLRVVRVEMRERYGEAWPWLFCEVIP